MPLLRCGRGCPPLLSCSRMRCPVAKRRATPRRSMSTARLPSAFGSRSSGRSRRALSQRLAERPSGVTSHSRTHRTVFGRLERVTVVAVTVHQVPGSKKASSIAISHTVISLLSIPSVVHDGVEVEAGPAYGSAGRGRGDNDAPHHHRRAAQAGALQLPL
jgi:hypothetical protein